MNYFKIIAAIVLLIGVGCTGQNENEMNSKQDNMIFLSYDKIVMDVKAYLQDHPDINIPIQHLRSQALAKDKIISCFVVKDKKLKHNGAIDHRNEKGFYLPLNSVTNIVFLYNNFNTKKTIILYLYYKQLQLIKVEQLELDFDIDKSMIWDPPKDLSDQEILDQFSE